MNVSIEQFYISSQHGNSQTILLHKQGKEFPLQINKPTSQADQSSNDIACIWVHCNVSWLRSLCTLLVIRVLQKNLNERRELKQNTTLSIGPDIRSSYWCKTWTEYRKNNRKSCVRLSNSFLRFTEGTELYFYGERTRHLRSILESYWCMTIGFF